MTQIDLPTAVSVIICCFNQARFLPEAINSVLCQSYQPIDIIVVDDGSSDDVDSVIRQYTNIRLFRQRNRGLSSARNFGLSASNCKFVTFLDADDRLLPDAIALSVRSLEENDDCAFVAGGFRSIDETGKLIGANCEWSNPANYTTLLRHNVIQMHGAVLYRRDILLGAGGFDELLNAAEDYDMYLRLARLHPFGQLRQPIAEYRQHSGNMTRDITRMLLGTMAVFEKQRVHVQGDRRLREELDRGRREYRQRYGRALLLSAVAYTRSPSTWGLAAMALLDMVRFAPDSILSIIPVAAQRLQHSRRRDPAGRIRS